MLQRLDARPRGARIFSDQIARTKVNYQFTRAISARAIVQYDRLTSDPGYNATLGAVHLGALIGDYKGSYVLALAAYNAGTARVAAWIKAHGIPAGRRKDADRGTGW